MNPTHLPPETAGSRHAATDILEPQTTLRLDRGQSLHRHKHDAPAETRASVQPKTGIVRPFLQGFSIGKAFTLFGFAVASLLILAFGLDLVFAWPFQRASVLFDATNVLCGIGLAYLGQNAWRDFR